MSDQPRERHIRRRDTGFRQTTPPHDTRPYRRASEATGSEMRTHTLDREQRWSQIGWHGQTGAFYALDEKPAHHEPGSYSPLWILVDNDPPTIGTMQEDECGSS
ncbi:hypothetical protein [Streptomyces lydicamycinicus]|uniref:hypothetical protein n=1 Tax=Streptomyces lydicamycinicus TaxID=1546107 RepID=UPI003C2DB99A